MGNCDSNYSQKETFTHRFLQSDLPPETPATLEDGLVTSTWWFPEFIWTWFTLCRLTETLKFSLSDDILLTLILSEKGQIKMLNGANDITAASPSSPAHDGQKQSGRSSQAAVRFYWLCLLLCVQGETSLHTFSELRDLKMIEAPC